MNGQIWYFSVVTNKAVMDDISQKMKFGMGAPKGMPGMPGNGPDKKPGKAPGDNNDNCS